jgi:hypothetical protein
LQQRSGLGLEKQKMSSNKEEDSFQKVEGTGFNPRLVINEDLYEDRKEDDIADNHEWEIGNGAFADVGEGDTPHRE